jgi:hypothetical protein
MKIKYAGPATVRVIDPYRWSKENGYVQDVPNEVAADLLTSPDNEFRLADGENATAAQETIEKVIDNIHPKRRSKKTK